MRFTLSFALSCLFSNASSLPSLDAGIAFIDTKRPHATMTKYTSAPDSTLLDVRVVVVGKHGNDGRKQELLLEGLRLELQGEKPDYRHPPMPGKDRAKSAMSGGVRALRAHNLPSFVSAVGSKSVELQNGCWEMIWEQNDPSGHIVCGFDVPEDVQRNHGGVVLPEGRLYFTFAVSTPEGLKILQERKRKKEERAKKYIEEREEQLALMKATPNPIMKMIHMNNAIGADEKYSYTGMKKIESVNFGEAVPLSDDLLLVKRGAIWTKKRSHNWSFNAVLGYAVASEGIDDRLMP